MYHSGTIENITTRYRSLHLIISFLSRSLLVIDNRSHLIHLVSSLCFLPYAPHDQERATTIIEPFDAILTLSSNFPRAVWGLSSS